MNYLNKLKKVAIGLLSGSMCLAGMSVSVMADEEKVLTNHNTYYIGTTEYNMDGTLVNQATDPCYQTVVTPDTSTDTTTGTDSSTGTDTSTDTSDQTKDDTKTDTEDKGNTDQSTDSETKTDTNTSTEQKQESSSTQTTTETKTNGTPSNYSSNTWYHPSDVVDSGYAGEVNNAIKLDSFVTNNWSKFTVAGNPFTMPQCTYFAWSRFYQIYGYDSGARGNGKTNAAEIVNAHPDKFRLSSTPAGGATFSIEMNSLQPEYGHVGFVEAFDGTYLWISEGNYDGGKIHFEKVSWEAFKAQYPDVVFAVPTEGYAQEVSSKDVELSSNDEVKTLIKDYETSHSNSVTEETK